MVCFFHGLLFLMFRNIIWTSSCNCFRLVLLNIIVYDCDDTSRLETRFHSVLSIRLVESGRLNSGSRSNITHTSGDFIPFKRQTHTDKLRVVQTHACAFSDFDVVRKTICSRFVQHARINGRRVREVCKNTMNQLRRTNGNVLFVYGAFLTRDVLSFRPLLSSSRTTGGWRYRHRRRSLFVYLLPRSGDTTAGRGEACAREWTRGSYHYTTYYSDAVGDGVCSVCVDHTASIG